jgi:hypothetical protein
MLELQPELRQVDDYIRSAPKEDWIAYRKAKDLLKRHVGFLAEESSHPSLRTSDAYDVGIKHITDVLEV